MELKADKCYQTISGYKHEHAKIEQRKNLGKQGWNAFRNKY